MKGKTSGIHATTLEANTALLIIVRRDSGESYQGFLTKLEKESGIETPTRKDLARPDRKRAKKGSNRDWTHPDDPDARITEMKESRAHRAHKTEHAVNLDASVLVGVTVQPADSCDTTTMVETLITAAEQVEAALPASEGIAEVVGDKGYHSTERIVDLEQLGLRTLISEPRQRRRRWRGDVEARNAVHSNRRLIRGRRGKVLLRRCGERLVRPFAHLYRTGGIRRTQLRGRINILKRVLIPVSPLNLGFLMRAMIGIGTPRGLQGRVSAVRYALHYILNAFSGLLEAVMTSLGAPRWLELLF